MSPTRKWILPLVLVLVVVGFIALTLRPGSSEKSETYSGLVQRVTDDPGSVQEVVFSPNRQGIEATLTDGTKIKTSYPSDEAQIQFQSFVIDTSQRFEDQLLQHSGGLFADDRPTPSGGRPPARSSGRRRTWSRARPAEAGRRWTPPSCTRARCPAGRPRW